MEGRTKTFTGNPTSKYDATIRKWKTMSRDERDEFRDTVNIRSMFSRCEEISPDMLHDEDTIDKGDFIILRVELRENEKNVNDSSQYQHDHLAIIKRRTREPKEREGFKVIHISDISQGGEIPKVEVWTMEKLVKNMKEGKASLVRFNFLDIQDADDEIIERALVYKIPKEEVRPLHFAYHSIFGLKEPIYCEEHLALLEENALLELRSDIPPYYVPIWLRKHKNGIFQVSFKDNEQEVQYMAYEDIINLEVNNHSLNKNNHVFIYYYPGVNVRSLHEIFGHTATEEFSHHTIHSAVEVSLIHAVEHGVSHALSHNLAGIVAYSVTAGAAQGAGAGVHFAVASAMAAKETSHIRHKEKLHKKTWGLRGLTRTRANKEVTKTWTGAGAGAAGSVGIGLGVIYGAAAGSVAPGVGTVVGAIVGGIVGSLLLSYTGKKVSGKLYDKNIQSKCPFCLN